MIAVSETSNVLFPLKGRTLWNGAKDLKRKNKAGNRQNGGIERWEDQSDIMFGRRCNLGAR